MDSAERKERGVQMWKQMLGPQRAEQTFQIWHDISPDFENYVQDFLGGEIWSRPGMDLRTRSLVTIASLAALGRPLALELNIRMALNNGATKQDIIETMLQIAPYAGFPACWEGLTIADRVFRENHPTSDQPST